MPFTARFFGAFARPLWRRRRRYFVDANSLCLRAPWFSIFLIESIRTRRFFPGKQEASQPTAQSRGRRPERITAVCQSARRQRIAPREMSDSRQDTARRASQQRREQGSRARCLSPDNASRCRSRCHAGIASAADRQKAPRHMLMLTPKERHRSRAPMQTRSAVKRRTTGQTPPAAIRIPPVRQKSPAAQRRGYGICNMSDSSVAPHERLKRQEEDAG